MRTPGCVGGLTLRSVGEVGRSVGLDIELDDVCADLGVDVFQDDRRIERIGLGSRAGGQHGVGLGQADDALLNAELVRSGVENNVIDQLVVRSDQGGVNEMGNGSSTDDREAAGLVLLQGCSDCAWRASDQPS